MGSGGNSGNVAYPPYECWSGGIEDAFESGISIMGAADMNVAGDHEFSFSGTLHKDSGARDTDVVSWSAYEGTLPELLHYHKRIDLLVTDQCESPTAAGDPYDDIEVHVALVQGAYPYSTLSVEELLPWSTPASDTPFAIELSAAQRVEVREGAHIVVGLRNVEDPLIPGVFPSLSYTAVVSIGAGSPALLGSTKASIPTRGYVRVSDAAAARSSGGEVHRFTLSDEKIADAELVYLRPRSALVAPEDAPQMIVADSGHETVSVATVDRHGGVSVSLARLDQRHGPFEIVLAAGRTAIDGELYYCTAADPGDCFDLEVDRLCGGGMCARDEICCESDPNSGPDCVDAENDPENCGGCGVACEEGEVCLSGVCAVVASLDCAGTTCPEGLACCEDDNGVPECVSLERDDDRCGSCGHACPSFATCINGICLPRTGEPCTKACTGSKTCCYALGWQSCVNTAMNRLNCGACGSLCAWDEECDEGECVPWLSVHDPCPLGRVNCGGEHALDCANLTNDESNCGDCGVRCAFGSTCTQGACRHPWSADENVGDEG